MIAFKNVTKRYGETIVLDQVDLQIEGGEFVTVVGPSGAGKSTLLHSLIGAESIDSGSIRVDGYEITEFSADTLQDYRRKVGMIFQDYKLLPKKTVFENVAFALEVCGWEDSDIKERVYEVLDRVGMLDHADKFPAQLAGGEGQRTAIARALVHRPRLLIADEPTGNLDYWNAQEILKMLRAINDDEVTVIMATHNRELVDQVQERVVVLNHGVVVSDKKNTGYDVNLLIDNHGKLTLEVSGASPVPPLDEPGWEGVGEIEITEVIS